MVFALTEVLVVFAFVGGIGLAEWVARGRLAALVDRVFAGNGRIAAVGVGAGGRVPIMVVASCQFIVAANGGLAGTSVTNLDTAIGATAIARDVVAVVAPLGALDEAVTAGRESPCPNFCRELRR